MIAAGALQPPPGNRASAGRPRELPVARAVVIEWSPLEDGDDVDAKLQEAAESLAVGGALYFTLPKGLDGEEIVGKLRSLFSSVGPLNIGTNPKINQGNNPRNRSRDGHEALCHKLAPKSEHTPMSRLLVFYQDVWYY